MGRRKKVLSEAGQKYLALENASQPLAPHVVERSDPLLSCAEGPDRSGRGFNIFRTLTSHGPQNFPIPTLCWRVLAQTSGRNDLSISNKAPLEGGVWAPKGAQRHELSIPQGHGLTRQTQLFFRFLSRPQPIWTGPYLGVPSEGSPGKPPLEKALTALSGEVKKGTSRDTF